jgi:ribosomal protein L16 Arg81 hydroxylase
MATIDFIKEPDGHYFNEHYFGKKPVIHKAAIRNSLCHRQWSVDYLKSVMGDRPVNVKHSKTGLFNISVGEQYQTMTVPFEKAVDLFTSGQYNNKAYYLQQYSIPEYFPELSQDLETPALLSASDMLSAINFWMGGAGCVTHLHHDKDHNFLVQVRGRKELTLFAPADSEFLYPNPGDAFSHVSRIELDHVELEQFPLFKHAAPMHCLLEEGDLLYMPPYWWHQVRSLDMAISVNYWWNRFDVTEGMGLEFLSVEQLCFQVKSFVDRGFSIDHKDEHGEPLLLKAVRKGYGNVVEAFLILGANPDPKSVQVAMEEGHDGIAELLAEYQK